jgi:mannose-6-phosphate isomerase-like protein (cupin superfamily)
MNRVDEILNKPPKKKQFENGKKSYEMTNANELRKLVSTSGFAEKYTPERCYITEIFNTNQFNDFSVTQARVAPGVITQIHKLKNTTEVYFILSGIGEVEVGGDVIRQVSKNGLVYIPRDTAQRIKNTGDQDLLFLCMCSPRSETKNYIDGV